MPASACSLHSRIQRPVEFAASPRDRPGPCRRVRLAPWSKMYVPTDSFGGMSPEHVASNVLKKLHIHASVEVIGKLEASGAKCLEPGAHSTLTALLKRAPVTNADHWLEDLMGKKDEGGALSSATRVMLDVRQKFAHENFDWNMMQQITRAGLEEESSTLMKEYMLGSFSLSAEDAASLDEGVSGVDGK